VNPAPVERPLARFSTGLYRDGHGRWRCLAHLPRGAQAWTGELADKRGWDHRCERFLAGFVERPACGRCTRGSSGQGRPGR
jgi:hypothetical protein